MVDRVYSDDALYSGASENLHRMLSKTGYCVDGQDVNDDYTKRTNQRYHWKEYRLTESVVFLVLLVVLVVFFVVLTWSSRARFS